MIRGVRAQGSLFGSSTLTPPWSLHFVDGAPLTLCAVLGGGGWVVLQFVLIAAVLAVEAPAVDQA